MEEGLWQMRSGNWEVGCWLGRHGHWGMGLDGEPGAQASGNGPERPGGQWGVSGGSAARRGRAAELQECASVEQEFHKWGGLKVWKQQGGPRRRAAAPLPQHTGCEKPTASM